MFKITKLLAAFAAMTAIASPVVVNYGHTAKAAPLVTQAVAPTTESAVNFHTTNSVAPFDDGGLTNRIAAAAVLHDYYQTTQPFKKWETTDEWTAYLNPTYQMSGNYAVPFITSDQGIWVTAVGKFLGLDNFTATIVQPQIKFLDHIDYPFENEYYHSYQLSWGIQTFTITSSNGGSVDEGHEWASLTGYWTVDWFSQEVDTQVHFDVPSQTFAIDNLTTKPVSALQTYNYNSSTIVNTFGNEDDTTFDGSQWIGYKSYDGFIPSTGDWSQPDSANNWLNPGW